jgi:hypothetical protein
VSDVPVEPEFLTVEVVPALHQHRYKVAGIFAPGKARYKVAGTFAPGKAGVQSAWHLQRSTFSATSWLHSKSHEPKALVEIARQIREARGAGNLRFTDEFDVRYQVPGTSYRHLVPGGTKRRSTKWLAPSPRDE